MNIRLTEAEIGEAMRRLAIMDRQQPRVELRGGAQKTPDPIIKRRALSVEMRDTGMPLALILSALYRMGYKVSMSTLKHDLTMARE